MKTIFLLFLAVVFSTNSFGTEEKSEEKNYYHIAQRIHYASSYLQHSPVNNKNKFLLALSWMPTFCKLHKNKTECKEKFHSSYFENHFALHGLWPQPRRNTYCDTEKYIKKLDRSGRWKSLPKLELSTELRYELEKAMPGYKSFLHRHEWIKHGSCYGKNETEYFSTSIRLLREINESKVQEFFSNNIGKRIYIDKVRDIFNDTFGRDAGKRISLRCKSGYIAEVWLNLLGNIDGEADIKNLLKDSDKSSASCRNGILYKYTASQ